MSQPSRRRAAQRVSFWVAVGGVSLLANFTAEVVAERFPQLGLRRFIAFTHKGAQ